MASKEKNARSTPCEFQTNHSKHTSKHETVNTTEGNFYRNSPLIQAAELCSKSRSALQAKTLNVGSSGNSENADAKISIWRESALHQPWKRYHDAQFQSISCHDWKCNCQVPHTVQEDKSIKSKKDGARKLVFKKSLLKPSTYMWDKSGNLVHKSDINENKELDVNFQRFKMNPVSVTKPFLVSDVHWNKETRSHTQRWPWKGGRVTSQLWSNN